jgi:peptidyl-prolyl cis-trans isomerase D
MLESLRRGAQSWVAKVLLGLLVVSFAVWGVEGIMTRGAGPDVVATVGNQEITAPTFQREMESQIRQVSEQMGQQLTLPQAYQFGLDRQVLGRLIAIAAFDAEADELGLEISDKVVAEDITSDPNLRGAFGRFDRDAFNNILQRIGMNEQAFIADRRAFMVRKQLFDVAQKGTVVSKTVMNAIFKYQDEIRAIDYVTLSDDAAGPIADPDANTLDAYYRTQAQRFTNPETRDFAVVELAPSDIAGSISLTDDELKTAYEQRHAEFDTPEKRVIDQIAFTTSDEAKAALARLRSGTGIAGIAEERGMSLEDVALGQVTRAQMLSPALADAAFALKIGEFSEPVQGPLGPVILHVAAVTPGVTQTFDQVKDKLKGVIAEERARSQVFDVQSSIEDQRAGGASLEEIAEKNNLKIVKFSGVTAKGTSLDGKPVAELPAYPKLLENVFASDLGDQVPPGDSGTGGYYWIRVDNVKASAMRPLAEVRTEAIAFWKEDQRREKLVVLANSLAERGDKGESIAALAAVAQGKVETAEDLRRFTGTDAISRNAVASIFARPKGGFAVGPAGQGDAIVLMQVREVENLPIDPSLEPYKQLESQLQQSYEDDILNTLASGLQAKHGVKINEAALQKLATTESVQ